MNLDDLKIIRSDERRSRRLTPLKDTFYADLKEYLGSLVGSKEPQKIDEYENALHVAEAIYDKRVAKIIKLAALTAKGHKEGAALTNEETKLFQMVFEAFTHYKEDMLAPTLSSDKHASLSQAYEQSALGATEPKQTDAHQVDAVSDIEKDRGMFDIEGEVIEEKSSAADTDIRQLDDTRPLIQENKNMKYVQVRVLADIPAFVGLDGENYKLSKGETALLPEGNAIALTKRQVAITIGDKVEDA